MKKFICLILLLNLQTVFAFEDCIVSGNGKLTDIKIENNKIIDVYPLITIMNDKNTLIVRPLQTGKTTFSVLKDNKERLYFSVNVEEDKTTISGAEEFDALTIDAPPEGYELDTPPEKVGRGEKVES